MIRFGDVVPGFTYPPLMDWRARLRLVRGLFSRNRTRRGMTFVMLGCKVLKWNVLISGDDDTITGLVMGDNNFLIRYANSKEKRSHG
jgi:hypothetical protein